MNADLLIARSSDLKRENEVLNLSPAAYPADVLVAGVSWTRMVFSDTSKPEVLSAILDFSIRKIEDNLPDHRVWLLIGNSVWQPDTRIVRYYGPWKALHADSIESEHRRNARHAVLTANGKIKFFLALDISGPSVEALATTLLEESCCYLIALPQSDGPEGFIEMGWSGHLWEDTAIISRSVMADAVLIFKVGDFDDVELGLTAVGKPELINMLARAGSDS